MVRRGLFGSILVLLGGLIASAVPASVAPSALEGLTALGSTMLGRMLGLAVTLAGLALLSWSWFLLMWTVRRGDLPLGERLPAVRRASAWWCVPLLLAPPLFSRDGWSYAAQGEMTRRGLSPYEMGPGVLGGGIVDAVDERWLHTVTPYGPLPLLWGELVASLSDEPWVLVVGHRLAALAGLVLLGYAVPRLASWRGQDPAFASALVLASPVTVAHGVAGLHNDLLMVGLMAVALTVVPTRGWLVASVLAGLAAAVKLPGGVICIGVLLLSLPAGVPIGARLQRIVGVGAVSGATVAGLGALAGVGVGWVHALGVPGSVHTPLSVTTQAGALVDVLLAQAGIPDTGAGVSVVRTAGAVLALGIAVVVAFGGPTGSSGGVVTAVATVTTTTLLLSPVVHPWYVFWCLPFLAVSVPEGKRRRVVVALALLFGLTAPLNSSLEGATGTIAVASVLVAGLAAALLWDEHLRLGRVTRSERAPDPAA